ncbi:MAG: aldehyde dehydrogenase family protein [Sulfurospirillum sp.]
MNKAKIYLGSEEKSTPNFIEVRNPFNSNVVSSYPICAISDVEMAYLKAKSASKETKKSPLHQRVSWLEDVANKLEEQSEKFAKLICDEVGKPMVFARGEVTRCIETIRLSAHTMISIGGESFDTTAMPSGKKTLAFFKRVPVGVALAITPFNFPLNLVVHKIAPALVSGNAVVLKPSSAAPLCAYSLAKLFIESPYAIKDALSVVYSGEGVNDALVTSRVPRVISFTGSVPVGNLITKKAGIKKIALELGGNAATFIDKSANLKDAAKKCAIGAFINSGQVCISLQRIYVHVEVYDKFAKLIADETSKLVVGNPYDDKTFIGPMIDEDAIDKAKIWIANAKQEGAKVLCGGGNKGLVLEPTIMADVKEDMNIVCQEVFAPIVSLIAKDSYEDALKSINDSEFGLQYSIFTNDLAMTTRAIDDLDAGGVVINDIPTLRFDIQPYGGFKHSGIGKEGPKFAILDDYTEVKSIVICS